MGKEKFRSNSNGEDKILPSNFAIVRSQQFSMGTELFPVGTNFRCTFSAGQLFVVFFWWGGGPTGAVTQECTKSGKKNKRSVKIYTFHF